MPGDVGANGPRTSLGFSTVSVTLGCTLESSGKLEKLLTPIPTPKVFGFHRCALPLGTLVSHTSSVVVKYRHLRSTVWRESVYKPLLDCSFALALLSWLQPKSRMWCLIKYCHPWTCKIGTVWLWLLPNAEWRMKSTWLLAIFWHLRNRSIGLCTDWKMKLNPIRVEEILLPLASMNCFCIFERNS